MGRHRFGRGKDLPPNFVRDVLSDAPPDAVAARWGIGTGNYYYWRKKLQASKGTTQIATSAASPEVANG